MLYIFAINYINENMKDENNATIDINQDNLSEGKTDICKRKKSLKERCKEIGAVSMDEFEAE